MARFSDLPPEVVRSILCCLDIPELTSLSFTNWSMRSAIINCNGLKFRLAAHEAGVESNENTSYLAFDRLSLLDRLENGWANLNFDFVKIIPVLHRASPHYDLTGGVFVLGDHNNRGVLHHITFPSCEGGEEVQWKKTDVGSPMIEFGLSVYEHDLLAVMTFSDILPHVNVTQLRLIQFSTGRPHPLAQKPVLTVEESRWPNPSTSIGISGGHLVVTFKNNSVDVAAYFSRLYILEWKTGIVKLDYQSRNCMYEGFIFLSPTILCIPNRWGGTFDIWHIPNEPSTNVSPKPFLHLALPALSPPSTIAHISCRGEPSPSPNGTPYSSHAFHPSSADAIVPFTIFFYHPVENYDAHRMYVHRRSLLELSSSREKDVIPWEEWGPRRTRWFQHPTNTARWVTTTTGQRAVILSNLDEYEDEEEEEEEEGQHEHGHGHENRHEGQQDGQNKVGKGDEEDDDKDNEDEDDQGDSELPAQRMTVLDFNPNSLMKKRMNTGDEPGPFIRVVRGKTVVRTKHILHPIETSLPYVSREIDLIYGSWEGLLMDEERLIGVKLNPEGCIALLQAYHVGGSRE
ncbi:hypothetical protein H0H92_013738 [Tricholoma furcatifolium]|nr:hypothetical protein H0H92_013738 [Tricholoma furcatifolium]